jgi:hypothetical protein
MAGLFQKTYYYCVFHRFFSAIAAFFNSLLRRSTRTEAKQSLNPADVDEVASNFYKTLINAERGQNQNGKRE